jgi:hypothetical protein
LANASLRSSPSDHPFREASPDDGVSHFPKRKFAMSQLANLAFFRARPGQIQALGAITKRLISQGANVLAVAFNDAGLSRLVAEVSDRRSTH